MHGEKSRNSGKFHVFLALHHHSQLKATVSYQDENAISKRQIKKGRAGMWGLAGIEHRCVFSIIYPFDTLN